ncbi:MAG: sugar transferase [Alphaproteobacteria bacterium]|nr:sugar transferase [Alphaproteobacteria bacterium]
MRTKYALDRALGTVAVAATAPLLGAIALAIRLEDGGPALFLQERPGLGARPFHVLKFRTMLVDADRFVDARGRPTRHRITRVGRWLRRTSLDELPQLVNIARGEMSFVGPRPPVIIHLQRYTDAQMRRFRMKPGLTGLAQISGRNQLSWSRRIALDNAYIDDFSLVGDLRILLRTVGVVVRREGMVDDRNPEQVDDLAPVGGWEDP